MVASTRTIRLRLAPTVNITPWILGLLLVTACCGCDGVIDATADKADNDAPTAAHEAAAPEAAAPEAAAPEAAQPKAAQPGTAQPEAVGAGNQGLGNDWPQINGPTRNGVASGETLLEQWPGGELQEIWSHPVGQGFAGPAVSRGRLVAFHRPGKRYVVEVLDAQTGKLIWNRELITKYGGGMDGDKGPKSVPLIHGDFVYVHGAGGIVYCLDFQTGKPVWELDTQAAYPSQAGFFGAGSSPIVSSGNLILNVGGRNTGIVALDLKTGKEVWTAFDDRASYSSPIEIQVSGKPVVVFITRLKMVGLDPTSGNVQFEMRFGKTGPTVNGAMPAQVKIDGQDYLFLSAAYGVGAKMLKVSAGGIEQEWANDESFSTQFSTPVFYQGNLFGTAGRQDHANGTFRCVESLTGNVRWSQAKIPVGHSILVGDKIVVLDSDGGLHVIEANGKRFKQLYQTQLFETNVFAMPALSNGLLYARSNAGRDGRGELICVEIGQRTK
ncbi:MAG: outer membrane protein assembly factor BamB [Mariniblastus sp.]|jgi:outer membrane protein assembly factor BamB